MSLTSLIKQQKEPFIRLDTANGNLLTWESECLFARQQIVRNDYSIKTAETNPNSLQSAILNVAAIGISLNPAQAHAYLVPRDGQICLDISYKGLVKLATDCGAILWAAPELVYENDTFKYRGVDTPPDFEADVFAEDRGELKGGFVLAKLPDGSHLVSHMSAKEIYKVRDTSILGKKKQGPWAQWFEEMAKKTLIKRAYKSWPQTENRVRLDKAVEVINEHEGMAYTIDEQVDFQKIVESGDAFKYLEYTAGMDGNKLQALRNSFQYGAKTELNRKCDELSAAGSKLLDEWTTPFKEAIDAGGYGGSHGNNG